MIAVISDIHGNLPALHAVIKDMPKVDKILCAGDIVGYNPYPNEVIQELKLLNALCILGNHDRAIVRGSTLHFNKYARAAIDWTNKNLSENSMLYLLSLPESMLVNIDGYKIAIHHGSPHNEDEYIMPEDANEELLKYDPADLLVLGHTHIPFIKHFKNGTILNPGAVGQPRDNDPRASYAIVDLKKWDFKIRRIKYDINTVERKILDAGLPSFLGKRLYHGF